MNLGAMLHIKVSVNSKKTNQKEILAPMMIYIFHSTERLRWSQAWVWKCSEARSNEWADFGKFEETGATWTIKSIKNLQIKILMDAT